MNTLIIGVTTYLGCLVSSFVPLVNAELLVLSAVALTPEGFRTPIIALAAAGQMTGKAIVYLTGSGSLRFGTVRDNPHVSRVVARLQSYHNGIPLILFASASVGLPPLFVMSFACGMLRIGLHRFVIVGLAGRLVRFGLLAQLPHLVANTIP